jgi:hypothetical protein
MKTVKLRRRTPKNAVRLKKKVTLKQVACPRVSVVLTGCVTVDSSVDQNSFLALARQRYPSPPAGLHDSRQAAIVNAQNCLAAAAQTVNIVGHGDQGLILTGSADINTTNPAKFIGLSNSVAWKADLAAITHPMTSLRLCACDTGAGPDGADLLSQLATRLGVPVEAPTGLVYLLSGTTDPYLEPCAQWQRATPGGARPAPIAPPKVHHHDPFMKVLVLRGVGFVAVSDVVSLQLYQTTNLDSPLLQSWSGSGAQVAVTFAEFDSPFEPGGVPAAIVTGMLVLKFKGATPTDQRTFLVYNHRLLQDMTYTDTYYYASINDLLEMRMPRIGNVARTQPKRKPAVKGRR